MKELLIYRLGVAALFVAVLTPAKGEADNGYKLKDEVNLCHRRPGVEPNGEHLANPGDDLIVYTNWTITDPTAPHRCLMRFSTCDYCYLHVQVETSFHYRQCPSPEAQKVYSGWCVPGCTYLHLYDQDYSNQTAASYTSSSSNLRILDFRTESRFLYMIACSNRSLDNDVFFHLRITAEDKTKYFHGTSAEIGRPQVFASPFFPEEYVLNSEVYKYVFQAVTLDEFITISFDDWQLSQYSSILFDSANIRGKIWGTNYRPWIISDKSRLEMTFETGPYRIPGTLRAFKGFRATYTFHSEDREDVPYVHTNCGWWIERQESGTVTFNPTANGYDYYDCIWVIKKHPNFQRILVKVINYSTRDNTYRHNQPNLLEIRNGLTSRGRLVESVVPSSSLDDIQVFRAHDSDTGFYVRIKGHYSGQRDFVLAFTCFNTDNCRDMFRCANDRCVPSDVTCNGIDNCGDNSDETESGCGGGASPSGARYTSPLNVGIIIPMVVSVFLIVVICLLVIFIRRCRRLSCQARRAQRRQQRINTVSGTVSRQQRRRRRGEHRREELGPPHDPPPSYEDVLNNTPIGYLNLGFFDASYSTTDPIQPPSYDEAISPSAVNPPGFGFQGSESHDLSSDSSSPETVERSQLNLSTSYSSDDTHTAENQHRSRQRAASSSSDSSNDIGGPLSNAADRQRGESSGTGSRGNGEESERTEGGPANTRRSIAKPEDSTIQLPVSSPANIIHHKDAKPNNKMQNARGNEGDDPPIISENLPPCSGMVPFADPESGERTSQPPSVCRVEMSPVITAPSLLSLTSHQGRSAPDSGQAHGGAPPTDLSNGASSRSRSDDLAPGMQAVGRCLSNEGASYTPKNEASPPRQERYGRPSPSRNIPPHIRKAKGGPSGMTMKHLSRSMDHIDRRCAQGEGDHALASMPPRLFSQSVHNICDAPPGRNERDGNHLAHLQKGCHRYQSQPLALGELPRRRDFSPEDVGPSAPESEPHPASGRQDRPRLDQDHGERRHDRSGSDQYPSPRCPEPQERGPRPQTLPRERNASQPGDRTTKPAPKPRKVCPPPGERGNDPEGRSNRPDPRAKQSHPPGERGNDLEPVEGGSNRPDPRGRKSHPPGERRNDPDGRPTRPDQRPMQTHAPEQRLNNPDSRPVRPDPRPRQAHPPGLRGDKPAERERRHPEQPGSPQRCEAGYAYGAQHLARDEPPPPYSRSLDRQRADPTHSRTPSMPHPQRNALSLERNGQHPGRECQADGDAHGRPDLLENRDRRGPSPAKASRPSQLPKPDGTPGPHPSQTQERRNLSRNQEAHHPGRTSGPPPYRASDSSRTHRPSDLRIPVGHQDQSRDQQGGLPDQNRGPDAFNQKRDTRHAKPDCPPKPARTGSVPQMGGRSAARPERGLEGGGRHEASQWNDPGPGSTTAGRTNSPKAPYCPTPNSAPNSTAASPHSPTPVSLLNNAPSISHSSAPDSALRNTYGAPCSPTANAGPRNPAPKSPQSTVDSSYSMGSRAHPNNTATNSSTGGQLDSPNPASGLNTNTDSALRATTMVDAFSAARMFPSPSSSGAVPAPFLSLRTGDVDEDEDIYV